MACGRIAMGKEKKAPDMRAWYCRGKKKTGKPIMVEHSGKKAINTNNLDIYLNSCVRSENA